MVLKSFQVSGVNFLLQKYNKHESCVLNDEAQLGKTVQIVSFVQNICQINDIKKILIVTNSSEKLSYWKYHFDTFTSHLTYSVVSSLDDVAEVVQNSRIILTQQKIHRELIEHFTYDVVVLESESAFDEEFVNDLKTEMIVFKTSEDITLNLDQLYFLAKRCLKTKMPLVLAEFKRRYCLTVLNDRRAYFQQREKLLTLCRMFRLRRLKFSVKDDLPLTDPKEFRKKYETWKYGDIKTVYFEPHTQSMSPLLFESDSESGASQEFKTPKRLTTRTIIIDKKVSPPSSPLSIPETQVSNSSERKDEPIVEKEIEEFDDSNYGGYVDEFQNAQTFSQPSPPHDSIFTQMYQKTPERELIRLPATPSPDVVVLSEKLNTPIYVSSSNSNSNGKKLKCYSPDLFAETSDEEADEQKSELSPLINDQSNFLNVLNKSTTVIFDFETPKAKSLTEKTDDEELPQNSEENVFEITKNDEFGNVLRITSDSEMSPIRVTDSDDAVVSYADERKPKVSPGMKRKIFDFSDSQKRLHVEAAVFTPPALEACDSDADDEREVNNKTPEPTPSPHTPTKRISSKKRSACKTESCSTPQNIAKNRLLYSSGWLSRSSPHSDSPKRKNRRRKLENMFKKNIFADVCSTEAMRQCPHRSESFKRFIGSPDSDCY